MLPAPRPLLLAAGACPTQRTDSWVHPGFILGPFWVRPGSVLGPSWVRPGPDNGQKYGKYSMFHTRRKNAVQHAKTCTSGQRPDHALINQRLRVGAGPLPKSEGNHR